MVITLKIINGTFVYWPSVEGVELHRSELGLWCQATLHDVSPYIVAHWGVWPGPIVYAFFFVLDSVIILLGVCVSHGCCVVCVWLDHHLHQHGGCGPTSATWLGGIATFTTARDQCTETVHCSSVIVVGCVTWYFGIQSMLLVIYALIMMLSCLDDVGFNASSLWWLACSRWCYLITRLSYVTTSMLDFINYIVACLGVMSLSWQHRWSNQWLGMLCIGDG